MLNNNLVRQNNRRISGSAMAWALVWLAGISGLVVFSVDRYVPMIEAKLSEDVRSALSLAEKSSIQVAVQGHQAILIGPVHDDQHRRVILDTAMSTPGIFSVADELLVNDSAAAFPSLEEDVTLLSGTASDNEDSNGQPVTVAIADAIMSGDLSFMEESGSVTAKSEAAALAQNPEQSGLSEPSTNQALPDTTPDAVADAATIVTSDASLATPSATLPNEALVEPAETGTATPEPEMTVQIRDGVMTIYGRLATSDAMEPLLQIARTSLPVNSISNYVVYDDDTATAEWLTPISSLLPALSLLEQPGLEITGDQIVLSGIASDEDTYDAVVNEALQTLVAFTLVEDIDIADTDELKALAELEAQARAERDAQAEAEAKAQAQKERDAKVKADREARAQVEALANAEREALEKAEIEAQAKSDADAQTEAEREAEVERQTQAETTAADEARAEAQAKAERETEAQAELDAQAALEREARQDTDVVNAKTSSIEPQPAGIGATAILPSGDPEPSDSITNTLNERRLALAAAMNDLESSRVMFRSGQDVLTTRSATVLEEIASILRGFPDVPVGIDGHTDSAGNSTQNLLLSQRRANAVREYLIENGVSVFRLSARGFGEEIPLAPNNTRRGRAANRRIEFNY